MKAQTLVPLAAAAAAQLLVVGNIAAAFAFQQKPPVETLVTVPVVAEIEQVECVRQDPVPYEPVTYQVPLDAELQSYTEKMCDLYDVPLELAYAVMQVESGFTPAAHSSTGDYGLMQINSINAGWLKDELGITDLLDARQNIQAGCYMLGMYLSEYEGNVNCALMAYNLGATGAKKAWSAGTYSTAYTDKVWNAMVWLLEGERDVSYSYASDYEIVTKLKTFSDRYGICLLVVHHTRKMEAEDSFDMISGTNGLLGAADGAFIMQKKRRTDNTALLDIVGRDQSDQELTLEFNRERCVWEFQGAETELWKLPPDPLLEAVAKVLSPEQPEWSGTPTELLERLSGVSIQANILTRKLNVSADRLYNDYGIRYESRRTHEGRVVKLTLENSGA